MIKRRGAITGAQALPDFSRRSPSRIRANLLALGIAPIMAITLVTQAQAAPTLSQVQDQIRTLQEKAASSGEAAQAASVQLAALTRQLNSVQSQAAADSQNVAQYKKALGAIAREEYATGGFGQGFSLLFSSNPAQYLQMAGTLNTVTKKKILQLRQFTAAKQQLTATSLTVNDKMALVKAAKAKVLAQEALVNVQLKEAQKLFDSLNKEQQKRLAELQAAAQAADQSRSLAAIKGANLGSGRGKVALEFAISQMSKWYVFGAAGMRFWDCSGLTMVAFSRAGVSLPHSAAAQFGYGRSISRNQLQPGDLVFFGYGSYIDHVGIYLRNGLMVNAPHAGARVRVDAFSSHFGGERFIGARRI
jgi:cell wall-associated NlpC family hydrolase